MNEGITIRAATAKDASLIAVVHAASIRGLASKHYEAAQVAAWAGRKEPERYEQALRDGEVMFVAQRGDGVIVGFGSYRADEVRAVYVDPTHARRGIGTRLLSAIETHAMEQGEAVVHLSSSLNAVAFYSVRGYVEQERASHPLRGGGELECVVMTKMLAPR